MNKKTFAIIGATFIGGMLLTTSAWAYRGDPNVQGPNYSPERHQAMIQAFENNDYNAWKEQMAGKGRVTQVINQDNFARFAEAHRLTLEGKTDEAKQIRSELGLGMRQRGRI